MRPRLTWFYHQNVISQCMFNSIALRKAKIVYNFGLSECNRVNKEEKFVLKLLVFRY